jgi:heme/copper-type cytochrome/quinol oxidase subunit 4
MDKRNKTLFIVAFVVGIALTSYGVYELTKTGGPCNSGIWFLCLAPVIFIISALQLSIFFHLSNSNSQKRSGWWLVSLACTSLWTICLTLFWEDNGQILYLLVFLIINIIATIINYKLGIKRKINSAI